MKKILVLGGTQFIGRRLVEFLQATKHNVTLFNRGKKNPELFPEYRKIIGDRETAEIKQIFKKDWDIVIDVSGYYPLSLEKLADGLKGKVGRYIFVSTISVFDLEKNYNKIMTEQTEIFNCSDSEKVDKSGETYGKRKAECERILQAREWLDTIILRPSIVYGKYDYTDRHYYWLYRVMRQNRILVPDNKFKGNYTFVDDFASLILESITMVNPAKVYNTTTHEPITTKELVENAIKISGKNPELIYATDDFLEKNKVEPWKDLPFWLRGNMQIDHSRLLKDFSYKLTPFQESIKKTNEYYASLGWPEAKTGFNLTHEKNLIEKLE